MSSGTRSRFLVRRPLRYTGGCSTIANMEKELTVKVSLICRVAMRVNAWSQRKNRLYSEVCGFYVSNGMMVRNGIAMPLAGVLSIGLAGSSLLGCAAMGLATLALAWNLFNETKKERR